jgi:hypothetical protein
MIRTKIVALGIVIAIGGPLAATTAVAQGPGRVAEPYTPAADAKDLKEIGRASCRERV